MATRNDELVEVFEKDPELLSWSRRKFLIRTGYLAVGATLADLYAVACGQSPTSTSIPPSTTVPVPRKGARIV